MLAWALLAVLGNGATGVSAPLPVVRGASAADTRAVRYAVSGARRRLARPECQRLLTDFRDADGATLETRLRTLAESPEGYLDQVIFYDGSANATCHRSQVLAFTGVGSRVVLVCGARFAEYRQKDPTYAELVLIHELLHSLGLGEDDSFPTSSRITASVRDRCE